MYMQVGWCSGFPLARASPFPGGWIGVYQGEKSYDVTTVADHRMICAVTAKTPNYQQQCFRGMLPRLYIVCMHVLRGAQVPYGALLQQI